MTEDTIIDTFFMNKSNYYAGLFMILLGVALFFISMYFLGGAGGVAILMIAVVGIILVGRSQKPLITFYQSYVEGVGFKRAYADIVKLEEGDKKITLYFSDDTEKVILLSAFDEKSAQELTRRFKEFINETKIEDQNE